MDASERVDKAVVTVAGEEDEEGDVEEEGAVVVMVVLLEGLGEDLAVETILIWLLLAQGTEVG